MMFYRLPIACVFAFAIAYSFRQSWRREEGKELDIEKKETGETYVFQNPILFVDLFFGVLIVCCLFHGVKEGIYEYSLAFFDIIANMAVYYVMLLIFVPVLRKYMSAKACAILWLFPIFLLYQPRSILGFAYIPIFHLYVPNQLLKIILCIWMAGFVVIFFWKCIGHLSFRHRLFQKSEKINDTFIMGIWKEELEKGNYKREVNIYYSENAKTPLSMGLSKRTRVVVLPHKIYNEEELHFIFRHEITHLKRLDIEAKFLLTFYNALCWFNPLTWIAVRKANEDLELSCDELVLRECDAAERRQYANLLLCTAGDERGFTTCLSVNAKALRYRLKNVIDKRTLHRGTVIIAIIFFCFYMSYGVVAVTTDRSTVKDVLCMEEKDLTIESVYYEGRRNDLGLSTVLFCDKERLIAYLSDLVVEKYVGVSEMTEDEIVSIYAGTAIGYVNIKFSTNLMAISTYDEEYETEYYRLKSEIDREYIRSCLGFNKD